MSGPLTTANSQTRKDSSVIANKDLRKAAIIIEQCNGCNTELRLKNYQVDSLERNIKVKENRISVVENNLAGQIKNNQLNDANYKEQIRLRDEGINNLENGLRQQKNKTLFIGIAGALALIFFLLK